MYHNKIETYKKLYEDENIQIGDIISLDPISNKVRLAYNRFLRPDKQIIRGMYKN